MKGPLLYSATQLVMLIYKKHYLHNSKVRIVVAEVHNNFNTWTDIEKKGPSPQYKL